MSWTNLISAVTAVITSNGSNDITGQLLQDLINNNLIPKLGNSNFKGVASLDTSPGTPESPDCYLLSKLGVYTNFGAYEKTDDHLTFLINNSGVWDEFKTEILTENILDAVGTNVTGGLIIDEAINAIGGAPFDSTGSTRTDYIQCDNLDFVLYTGSAKGQSGLVFYDENKTWISPAGYTGVTLETFSKKIAVPSGAKYLRASSRESDTDVKIVTNSNSKIQDLISKLSENTEVFPNFYETWKSSSILKNLHAANSYASYNNGVTNSETNIIGTLPVLAEVGDYVEIECRYTNASDSYTRSLNLLLGTTGTSDRFGYNVAEFWFRIAADGSAYTVWDNLTNDRREWSTLKLEVVAAGWELFVDGISMGTKTKNSDFEIQAFCKPASGSIIEQYYDIRSATIHTSLNDWNFNPIALYGGSENVKLVSELAENTNFLSFDATTNIFKYYQRDADNPNVYISFEVDLNSSRGLDTDEIQYKHLWETRQGNRCEYDEVTNTMTEFEELLVNGESECTFYHTGINGSKIDHTGGIHGDETIDIDPNSFVWFFLDGQKLDPSDYAESFSLIPCHSFKYVQRSAFHETGESILNKDTGIAATGAGVLGVNSSNNNFTVDGVDTGIIAYSEAGFLSDASSETLSDVGGNWAISRVREVVAGHPIVGQHFKETYFENLGYRTINTLNFAVGRDLVHWYSGICSIHKNSALIGFSNDFSEHTFTGTTDSFLESDTNRFFKAYNPNTGLSVEIDSKLLTEGSNIKEYKVKTVDGSGTTVQEQNANMRVWDRASDSKYYRQHPDFTPVIGESISSEMVVKLKYKKP